MRNILIKPVITEKSVAGTEKKCYSFFIHPDANKYQVKKAVADTFKVEVDSVRIINVKPKTRQRGRIIGKTAMKKKAIVKLQKDQKIEFFEKL